MECICIGAHCYYASLQREDYFWKPKSGVNFSSVRRIPRGGETSAFEGEIQEGINSELHLDSERAREQTKKKDLSVLPLIDAETVSLALRLTCETNRRLHHGTSSMAVSRSITSNTNAAATPTAPRQRLNLQPSHEQQLVHHPSVNVHMPHEQSMGHPIEAAAKRIKAISQLERAEERRKEERTIFHATDPWQNEVGTERKGVLRWGPDLKVYVETLLAAIGLGNNNTNDSMSTSSISIHTKRKQPASAMEDERQLILSLTIMYLDRATSLDNLHIDPNTGQPWYPSCPYVIPKTVHRLVLTAFNVATKTIRGNSDASNSLREAANTLLQGESNIKSQISEEEMQEMQQWMMNALGGASHNQYHYENNWQIPPDEIGKFIRKWGETFYPKRVAAQDERNRSRMERLERFWREQSTSVFGGYGQHNNAFGADHGHGNHHAVGWDGHYGSGYQHHDGNALHHRAGYETFGPQHQH